MRATLHGALAALTISFGLGLPALANAQPDTDSSIQYYGDAKRTHDTKIEAAAIEKAASKIGDLRGTITGSGKRAWINPPKPEAKNTRSSLINILRNDPAGDNDPTELPPVPIV